MKIKDVEYCSFQNWYNDFKKMTIKSIILPLPDGFVSYILKDGIVLPKSSQTTVSIQPDESDISDEEENWEDSDTDEAEAPNFVDFDARVKDAIRILGGKVFPKLNWSSPRDASWIAFNNSCCCTTVSDIYLLLKSSDFIIHDLTKIFLHCEDFDSKLTPIQPSVTYYLVLKKWIEIDTSAEFRCFVKDNALIGISQREHSIYFDHIGSHRNEIVQDITSFFKNHVQFKFPCANYVFDVYREKKDYVRLIDFNPFGQITESLLFQWTELSNRTIVHEDCNEFPEFRYVVDNHGVQPRPLSYHAIPKDIVDISTGEDSFKLVDLIKLKIDEQTTGDASTDDESNQEEWKI